MTLQSTMLTGEQIRAARAFVRLDQLDLAKIAGVSLETVKRLERMHGQVEANTRTVAAIASAFAKLGVVFDLSQGHGAGLRWAEEVPPQIELPAKRCA